MFVCQLAGWQNFTTLQHWKDTLLYTKLVRLITGLIHWEQSVRRRRRVAAQLISYSPAAAAAAIRLLVRISHNCTLTLWIHWNNLSYCKANTVASMATQKWWPPPQSLKRQESFFLQKRKKTDFNCQMCCSRKRSQQARKWGLGNWNRLLTDWLWANAILSLSTSLPTLLAQHFGYFYFFYFFCYSHSFRPVMEKLGAIEEASFGRQAGRQWPPHTIFD